VCYDAAVMSEFKSKTKKNYLVFMRIGNNYMSQTFKVVIILHVISSCPVSPVKSTLSVQNFT
jgi:hypothetical protein